MDNFRQPRPQTRTRTTIDGFVSGSGIHPPSGRRVVKRQPIHVKPKSSGRPMDDFKRVSPSKTFVPTEKVQSPLQLPIEAPRLPKLNLNLDLDDAPASKRETRQKVWRTFRRWSLRSAVVVVVLVMGIGGFLFAQGYIKLHKVFKGTAVSAVALEKNVNPTLLKGEGDGRINILLLGNGGDGHDGPDLTDTMMVASIDPVNKTAALLSVPRDLWVTMPNKFMGSSQKINAAYEAGKYEYLGKEDSSNANTDAVVAGFQAADQVVTQVLGITIDYNLVLNFQGFQQAVDSVGGVTVNVPTELYDPTMEWQNNWNPVLAKPGVQQMNGAQALLYVRSRETSSDFARSERQRQVIVALKDKTLTLGTLSNPLKISQLMSAFGNNAVTDISLSDAVRLYDLTKSIDNSQIQSLDLVTPPNQLITTANLNGISIDEPLAGLDQYGPIQQYVRSQLKDGYITKENAQITLLNGTSNPNLGTQEATDLKTYGYNITTVGNAPTQNYDKTVIVDLSKGVDKYTAHYLENRFGVSTVTQLPDSTIQAGQADFIIILGNDETTSSQN